VRVAVIGNGVNGLSCSYELADRHEVTVFHEQALSETTSATATAIWHVYLVDPNDAQNLAWSEQTLNRLIVLSKDPATSIELCVGVELFREGEAARPSWADIAANFELLPEDEIAKYPGRTWGYRIAAPTANMAKYLPWLHEKCVSSGVKFVKETVTSLDDLLTSFDAVVNCAGLHAAKLTQDDELFPMKGQYIAYKQGPDSPTEYIGDDQHPDGMAYLIPRDGELLIGGTEEPGEYTTDFTADRQNLIERAGLFTTYDLTKLEEIGVVVGLRPCRTSKHVRFGPDPDEPRVLHNYGHGGSGFSLAWGCAASIVELVDDLK
jgi:D-amino-acid oxidase